MTPDSSLSATVLLVDDDPNILKLLEYTYRHQGYTILTAVDGAAALKVLEEHVPDIIVTDVMMPVMNGHELCRKVRSDKRWETLPFIFLSARGSTDDRIAGLDLGADDYVVKPFDRRELLAKTKTLLNRVRIYRNQITEGGAAEAKARPTLALAEMATRPAHVLVVDDEEPMRQLIEHYLRQAYFEVTAVSNGEEALKAVAHQAPDLIISDVIMPVMDGIQLRQALLKQEEFNTIPFLFLTAKGQPEEMANGLSLGVDDYLTKPITPQVLIQKTRNLVDRYRSSADRYRKELQQAAHRISMHLEPNVPQLDRMTLAQRCQPLEVRGGDYYDYIELGNGRIAAIIGDVMGKKWGAWFFSVAYIAYLRSVIRSTSAVQTSPAAIIGQINRLLWEDLKISEVFTTLIFGIIDPATRTMTYANAGHLPPLCYRAATGEVEMCEPGGLILGVQQDQTYDETTRTFAPGDVMVLYTDGITEARNKAGELYGSERLREAVKAVGNRDAKGVVSGIFEATERFAAGAPSEDDRTVLVIRANP